MGIGTDILQGVGSFAKDAFSSANLGSTLKGVGSLAGAWGEYNLSNKLSKIEQQKLDYEKKKDQWMKDQFQKRQDNLDLAVENVFGATTLPNTTGA